MTFRRDETAPTAAPFDETAGSAYASLIEAELNDQNRMRASLHRRAATMTTTTGAIVTAAVAVTSLLRPTSESIPAAVVAALVVGLLALVFSLVCGVNAQRPGAYASATPSALTRLTDTKFWNAPVRIGTRRVAQLRVEELGGARVADRTAAGWLLYGYTSQVVGIVSLAAAAVLFGATYLPAPSFDPGGSPGGGVPGQGPPGFGPSAPFGPSGPGGPGAPGGAGGPVPFGGPTQPPSPSP